MSILHSKVVWASVIVSIWLVSFLINVKPVSFILSKDFPEVFAHNAICSPYFLGSKILREKYFYDVTKLNQAFNEAVICLNIDVNDLINPSYTVVSVEPEFLKIAGL